MPLACLRSNIRTRTPAPHCRSSTAARSCRHYERRMPFCRALYKRSETIFCRRIIVTPAGPLHPGRTSLC
jgi:hypothetical protein